jgi:hypothetical protein
LFDVCSRAEPCDLYPQRSIPRFQVGDLSRESAQSAIVGNDVGLSRYRAKGENAKNGEYKH